MKQYEAVDRHVLVTAIWAPSGLLAVILLQKGLISGGGWWFAAGFAALIAGFIAHIIADAVLGTSFTVGEVALASVLFAIALLWFLLTALIGDRELASRIFLPVGLGLISLVVAVIFYMVVAFGARAAFERFDIIRDNHPRPSSRLPHRGGRR